MIKKIIVSKNATWCSSSIYKRAKLPYEQLNPVQKAYASVVEEDANIIVEAPTSTGKTVIAVMGVISNGLAKKKKAIYLSPLKALAQEKIDEWTDKKGIFNNQNVVIVSGDYINYDAHGREEIIKKMHEADIIIMTTEMFSSMLRRQNKIASLFMEVGVVIVDEFHLIGVPVRGTALETSIMKFTEINKSASLIFLSATLSNANRIAEWMNMLNGKLTYHIYSEWRHCELEMLFIPFADKKNKPSFKNTSKININDNNDNEIENGTEKKVNLIKIIKNIIDENPNDKILIFVHSKSFGEEITTYFRINGYNILFYNADLDVSVREKYIEKFKQRGTKGTNLLVSTSALAWGVNLPARRVIIANVTRNNEDVSVEDILQMCGRAGRMGIDDKGTAYIIIPSSDFDYHKKRITTIPPAISNLYDKKEMMFHLINEIVEGSSTGNEIGKWFERSFAAFGFDSNIVKTKEEQQKIKENNETNIIQTEEYIHNDADIKKNIEKLNKYKTSKERVNYIAEVIIDLIKVNAIYINDKDEIKPTFIGKLSAWFYYNPVFISSIFMNILNYKNYLDNNLIISWIMGFAYNLITTSYINIKNKPVHDHYMMKLYNYLMKIFTIYKKNLGLQYINRNTTTLPFLIYLYLEGDTHYEPDFDIKISNIRNDNDRYLTMLQTSISLIKKYKIKNYYDIIQKININKWKIK